MKMQRAAWVGLAAAVCASGYTWEFSTDLSGENGYLQEFNIDPSVSFPGGNFQPNSGGLLYVGPVSGVNPNDYDIISLTGFSQGSTVMNLVRATDVNCYQGGGRYISAELVFPNQPASATTLNINQCTSGG